MKYSMSVAQVLCDFHNLQLECGRVYREVVSGITLDERNTALLDGRLKVIAGTTRLQVGVQWPTDEEQERIIRFFRRTSPETLTFRSAQEIKAKKQKEGQGRILTLTGTAEIWSLGGYEHKHKHKTSWFDSKDFLDFADHWRCLARLISGVAKGELELAWLQWFKEQALTWETPRSEGEPDRESYRVTLGLKNPKGKPVNVFLTRVEEDVETISLREWKVYETHTLPSIRFGLNIGFMLYTTHRMILYAMEHPEEVRFGHCQASATARVPACQNIFAIVKRRGPEQKYCSGSCRRRTHQAAQNRNRTQKGQKRP